MAVVAKTRSVLQIDVFGGVSVGKLIVMAAALLSLFIDQSNTFYWVVIIPTPWLIDRFVDASSSELDTWRLAY
jgi:hypothetical protein